MIYGQGTVSPNGLQVLPDEGVELHRFTCLPVTVYLGAGVAYVARVLGGLRGGDPVDLATGLLTVDQTDLVLPDVIPLVIQRHFRAGQGGGWTYHHFQMALLGDTTAYSYADLLLADGARVHYVRTSPGTDREGAVMEHTATPETNPRKPQVTVAPSPRRYPVSRR